MDKATEVVIGGCSAGGLAVYLGIDQMSSIIREINPSASVRGLADSGIFLDHSSKHAAKVTYQKYGRDEASINGMMDYGSAMKSIYTLMNITSGTNPACLNAHHTGTISTPIGDVPSHTKCIFAGEVAPFIQTPVFALQVR